MLASVHQSLVTASCSPYSLVTACRSALTDAGEENDPAVHRWTEEDQRRQQCSGQAMLMSAYLYSHKSRGC
jgi:hypothetical protein